MISLRRRTFSFCKYVYIKRSLCSEAGNVRVRFAPSPTGFLHLGGLRTALYNYLFAKSRNGTFVLRIEDTDQTRLVDGAVQKLEQDLQWSGINPNESPSKGGPYGPYLQSQRLPLYKQEVKKLLANGSAYYCFCTERRLDLLRKDAARRREQAKYDNRCRHLTEQEVKEKLDSNSEYCIRFKLTSMQEPFHDLVYGPVRINIAEVEGDPVIVKSDQYPTYHFANVVDDHYMRITHVLRGVEWQPSTTKHLLMYKAFGWTPPEYAHLPMLLNDDGSKLSKRVGSATVEAYRADGVRPEALINFISICGGGFEKEKTQSSSEVQLKNMNELAQMFRLDLVHSHNCQVPHDKLKEYNRMALRNMIADERIQELVIAVKDLLKQKYSDNKYIVDTVDEKRMKNIISWSIDRITKLSDLVGPDFSFLWTMPSNEKLSKFEEKYFDILEPFINDLQNIPEFNEQAFSGYFKEFASAHGVEYRKFMKFLRTILCGDSLGPSIKELLIHLGKENSLNRLNRARAFGKQTLVEKKA